MSPHSVKLSIIIHDINELYRARYEGPLSPPMNDTFLPKPCSNSKTSPAFKGEKNTKCLMLMIMSLHIESIEFPLHVFVFRISLFLSYSFGVILRLLN